MVQTHTHTGTIIMVQTYIHTHTHTLRAWLLYLLVYHVLGVFPTYQDAWTSEVGGATLASSPFRVPSHSLTLTETWKLGRWVLCENL